MKMQTVLIFAILAFGVVIHADVAHRWECDKVAIDAVCNAVSDCGITFEFVAQFLVPEAMMDQSSEIEILNKTNVRSKRNFGDIQIPDGWGVDFGAELAKVNTKPLTMEERMEKLEELIYCVEQQVKMNPFCAEVFEECQRKIDEAPVDSTSLFACFFEQSCDRCPEIVAFLLMDFTAINQAY